MKTKRTEYRHRTPGLSARERKEGSNKQRRREAKQAATFHHSNRQDKTP